MDKKPKKSEVLTTKNIFGILADFFEQMILPNFDRIDKKLEEHDKRFENIEAHLDEHDRRFDKLDDRLDRHSNMFEKHEKEITSLKLAHLN